MEGPTRASARSVSKALDSVPEQKLRDEIKSSYYIFIFRDGKYDPSQVDEDVASLRQYYESKGFFDVRIGRKLVWSPDLWRLADRLCDRRGNAIHVDQCCFSEQWSLRTMSFALD